jgi:hypothetical protein
MKQCFSHRSPSHVTLLCDPWPEDFSETRAKVERLMKTGELPLPSKNNRRKTNRGPASS